MYKLKKVWKWLDKFYFIILLISLFLLIPILNNNYFEGHDTGYHIANILSLSYNLSYKNLFTLKIFPMIAHNFGYGAGIFYPQLVHTLAAIFYKMIPNINVFTAIKITDFISIAFSGLFMYHFMKCVTKNKTISFVSTIFYMTAPYKIYDYIVRDAEAESLVFIFLPIVFNSVYYLLNNQYKKFYLYFVLGYVGLISSHLVMTIYVTLFLGIILLIYFNKLKTEKKIKHFLLATILVLGISSPFLIPLVEHMLTHNYVAFQKNSMANPFGVYWNGLKPYQFFIGSRNIGYHFINIVAIFLIIYLFFQIKSFKKVRQKIKKDFLFATGMICTFLGIWMSSLAFPWMILPNFLLMIQFPYRLGTLTAFGVSILCSYALQEIKQKKIIVLSILSCICVSLFCLFTQNYRTISKNEYDLSQIGMGWQEEYLPNKAKENSDYLNTRSEEIILEEGTGQIKLIENKTPYLKFQVNTKEQVTLELPRLYYLGYQIKAIYDHSEEEIPYYENKKGFIEIKVKKSAIIEMNYTGTIYDQLSNKISVITVCLFVAVLIWKKEV